MPDKMFTLFSISSVFSHNKFSAVMITHEDGFIKCLECIPIMELDMKPVI